MKISNVILFFILINNFLFGQNIGNWKIYSDLKTINSISLDNNIIWASTSGGVFNYNLTDSSFKTFSKANGLNSQNASSITIVNSKNIWIGFGEGFINVINTNDNTINKIVDIYNTNKSKKQINDFFVSGDSILVSIDFGLSIINSKTYSLIDSYLKFGSFSSESKVVSAIKNKNIIYVLTESGVAVQKTGASNLAAPESWTNYFFGIQIPALSATKMITYNNEIYLASSNGIIKFTNGSWQSILLNTTKIKDLLFVNNELFFITDNIFYKYSNNTIQKIYENNNLIFNRIIFSNQKFYIASSDGILEYNNNRIKQIIPNGPASNSFLNLSISPNGDLWVATGKDVTGKGFYKYDGDKWFTFNTKSISNLPSNAIYNIFVGKDSSVYLATWGFGAGVYKKNILTIYNTTNSGMVGIPANDKFLVISDIKQDSKGNVWFVNPLSAAGKPLSVLTSQNKWFHYSFNNPSISTSEFLDKMVIDQYDTKWFFAIQGNRGLYYFNEKGTFENLTDDLQGFIGKSDGLSSDIISSLAIDKRGSLWIGTNVGVNVISDPQKPKATLTSLVGLAVRNQNVNCIAVDPINQKWIGTNNGVFVLSSDGYQLIQYYNTKNSPLPDNNITSITFNPLNGKVFIGTDYGLAELETEFLEPKESFSDLLIYPNPFVIGDKEKNIVTIDGLIARSKLKITKVNGELIKEYNSPGGRIAFWDGKDENGNYVSSGVYFIIAYDEEANSVKTSKIAVIRK
ncbi:MAG: hypothetical protein N2321_06560 [Melioribacteraceae bacterium]|nr:hypothetical protein [Melioribacteraceae bacterium]